MARIFYAWEMGANFGHIGPFLPLARGLRDRGHELRWAVAQTGPAARLLRREGFTWYQAPTTPERPRPGPPLSYADILLRFGYADEEELLGLVVAWRELLKVSASELMLADHAPTALLAARTLKLPVMLFSNGFTVPPRTRPLPNMRPWLDLPDTQLLAIENEALERVNGVLAHFGLPPLAALWRLFDVEEEALVTFPELDHYDNRGDARYWGSLPSAAVGEPPHWPGGEAPRVFAYLRPEIPHGQETLEALRRLEWPTLVYMPGLSSELKQQLENDRLTFASGPVDLIRTARESDIGVTYSSLSTTTAFLMAGKPLLLLPSHLEQFLLARRVSQMEAGWVVDPEQPAADLVAVLNTLHQDSRYRTNAQAFAKRYAAFSQEQVVHNLVRRIESLTPGGIINGS